MYVVFYDKINYISLFENRRSDGHAMSLLRINPTIRESPLISSRLIIDIDS